jgi:hypothetical protein
MSTGQAREAGTTEWGECSTPSKVMSIIADKLSDHGLDVRSSEQGSHSVTEEVYRQQLKPVITKGAETMNTIFNQQNQAKSA